MYSLCNCAGSIICIDVIAVIIIIKSDWKNNRKKIFFQQIIKNFRVYFCNIPYKSNILSIGIFLLTFQQSTVFSTDTNSLYSKGFHMGNKLFVYSCENHLCNLHCLGIGYTKTIDKLGFHSYFSNPFADFLATTMHNDRLETNQFQKNCVLNYICLQFFIQHSTSAIFYYYDLTIKTLYIRKCLNQHLCLIKIFLIYHFLLTFLSYIFYVIEFLQPHTC